MDQEWFSRGRRIRTRMQGIRVVNPERKQSESWEKFVLTTEVFHSANIMKTPGSLGKCALSGQCCNIMGLLSG